MNPPPDWVIEEARLAALNSPCLKSKRGVVLFEPALEQRRVGLGSDLSNAIRNMIIVADGFNGPPDNMRDTFYCTGTEVCRSDCAKLCLHAEERAIHAGLHGSLSIMPHLELVHVKVVDGRVVAGGGPSCWQCSRLVVEVGLRGVWLYEADSGPRGQAIDEWRFYTAEEFHRATLRTCQLGDPEFQ